MVVSRKCPTHSPATFSIHRLDASHASFPFPLSSLNSDTTCILSKAIHNLLGMFVTKPANIYSFLWLTYILFLLYCSLTEPYRNIHYKNHTDIVSYERDLTPQTLMSLSVSNSYCLLI